MIYNLSFVSHILIWRKKKKYFVYKSKDISKRKKISYKILRELKIKSFS